MKPSFEQVWPRLFFQPNWGWKCLFGGILMAFPVINFLAFGYLYRVCEEGRRGRPLILPEWEEWRELFLDGLYFFLIFLVFAVVPLTLAWLLSRLPFLSVLGMLAYTPMVPVMLLAAPTTAAALFCFQARRRLVDAFEIKRLFIMLQAEPQEFVVPTLVFLGILLAGAPILPLAFFVGSAIVFHFYFTLFHRLETRMPTGPSGPYTFL